MSLRFLQSNEKRKYIYFIGFTQGTQNVVLF